MYRLSANSRATISSTAIFLSQQSRQYFSSPRGSDTSLAPHSAQRDLTTALRDISLESIACRDRGLGSGWWLLVGWRLLASGLGRLLASSRQPSPRPPT